MENVSKALIIAVSIFIAMLVIGLMTYVFQSISNFAQKQVTSEEVSEVLKFNQPYLELEYKATHDYSGNFKQHSIGATAEDIISIINYTNHVNATTVYYVSFKYLFDGEVITNEDFNIEKQQEFIEKDLKIKEKDINSEGLRYSCKIGYNESDIAARVNSVIVTIYNDD